ncbi:PREDICTED: transcription factor DIVARICATA-like [Tarenaya hassleriana]|uniref:transcription factor DIVARICATA-like n=1 Tax=Tarenaya hassleriana TaxID=28532 RepID=UPI00053C0B56|nr:PREDICTED: transcription factor DIVARICATA-like [Tarenaya hassleriana]
MEILRPTSHVTGGNWLRPEETAKNSSAGATWTAAENKAFENALAVYDEDSPDRWQKVAAMIPGKTVSDVIKQYTELEADVSNIEAGLVPVPGYIMPSPQFTLDWTAAAGYKELKAMGNKRPTAARPPEHERKKGVPWTEEEHKLFLMGLKKYGKGDWRNISRNYVITRTPTQVASHAQKYFIRQLSGGKDKRRASIHDITTFNLDDDEAHVKSSVTVNSPALIIPWSNSSSSSNGQSFNSTLSFHSSYPHI